MLKRTVSLPGLPQSKAKKADPVPQLSAGDQTAIEVYAHAYSLAKKLGCSDLEVLRTLNNSIIVIANATDSEHGTVLEKLARQFKGAEK